MGVMTSQTLDVTAVVELARLAPSVHNTQPWSFRAHGDTVELWADETRHLRVLDPDARQQTISCGAALYLARLGLRLQGFDASVELLPAGGGGPLARIKAVAGAPVTAEEVVLERAARSRHMQRGAFEDRRVDPAAVDAVREATHAEGAWVRFLESSEDQIPVAVLLSRADELETSDEAYREELRAWTARPAQTRDGLTAEATSLGEGVRGSDLRLRDFSPRGARAGFGGRAGPVRAAPAGRGGRRGGVAPGAGPRPAVDEAPAGGRALARRSPADGPAARARPTGAADTATSHRGATDLT